MPRKARSDFGIIHWTTRIGIVLEQGEIVLIPIPFTDLLRRSGGRLLLFPTRTTIAERVTCFVVAMTSNPAKVEHGFQIDTVDLAKGQLNHPGTVRVDRIYTMSQSLIVKRFGKVNEATLDRIRAVLADLVSRKD